MHVWLVAFIKNSTLPPLPKNTHTYINIHIHIQGVCTYVRRYVYEYFVYISVYNNVYTHTYSHMCIDVSVVAV